MELVVISHKPCWPSAFSPSGYATDGGFSFQMRALSELFDETKVVVPCSGLGVRNGEVFLRGHRLSVIPLTFPLGKGVWRKIGLPLWLLRNSIRLLKVLLDADVVHIPIPSDIGTLGMILAFIFHKPIFVRYCGNWFAQRTVTERFLKWFMEKFASEKNIMMATGERPDPPSQNNRAIRWIFATTLSAEEIKNIGRPHELSIEKGLRLIIACRQEKDKGTGAVIKSLPLIMKDFSKVFLDVVGDGGALKEFKKIAMALGVDDRVSFYGKVDHTKVIHLLQQADLFCYPTVASEGFPKVVHEALACGLPVITTKVSTLSYLLETGCGILLREPTPTAVAQAVKEILLDPKRYGAMSKIALETAKRYSLERWQEEIRKLLEGALGPLSRNRYGCYENNKKS